MTRKEQGFSLIELLIVVAIILIIVAIAIPHLTASRQRANEAAAVAALRVLNSSQIAFNSMYGNLQGFAASLSSLGPASTCDLNHACLVDEALGCAAEPCRRGGYNFFSISDDSSAPYHDYAFTATPVGWNSSGGKNFCTSEDGIIRYQLNGTASVSAAVPHGTCINFAQYGSIQ